MGVVKGEFLGSDKLGFIVANNMLGFFVAYKFEKQKIT